MERITDCPSCYGKFTPKNADCPNCVYLDSCNWYTNAGTPGKARRSLVSLEASGRLSEGEASAYRESQRSGLPESNVTLRELADFALYLLTLDESSLSLIQDVLDGKATVKDIAEGRKVSRQYAHHTVLRSIELHPELSVLYMALMPKLTAARRRRLRGNTRSKTKTEKKK